jgi:hypothetical protein
MDELAWISSAAKNLEKALEPRSELQGLDMPGPLSIPGEACLAPGSLQAPYALRGSTAFSG